MNFDLKEHLVLKTLAGSCAYGTSNEDSDKDFRGVIIPPEEYFLGLKKFEKCEYDPPNTDVCYYDIRKFFSLALQGNPNILEIFKSPRIRFIHPFADTILHMWPQVLSGNLVKSHVGMAKAHLKRLDSANRKCGVKGKKLIEKYGYNTKDAMHVIRTLQQCIEILETGELTLPRPNAASLVNILNGGYSLDAIKTVAESYLSNIRNLENKTSLPQKPDVHLVSRNVKHIVRGWIYSKRSGCKHLVIDREKS